MTHFPTLTTKRLVLRKLTPDDATELLKLRSDDEVNKYLDRPKTTTINEAIEFINKIDAAVATGASFYWAISLHDDPKLIGTICYWNWDENSSQAEVGYELSPVYQGKGLMQDALAAIIEFGFATLKLKTIVAVPISANDKSIRLLEKNKFTRDTTAEGEHDDKNESITEIIYSLKNPFIAKQS
jgi:[ribosomal protein S5]-alanine N-acetyltransferase